ncbi:Protein ULTRAPETALA 2 [Glycine max]|nr:Protein ULTRAPETALA 2 [Glycine max]
MTTSDPSKQKRSQENDKKTKDDNITQGPSKQRKQFRVGDDGKILFDEEELKMILDFKRVNVTLEAFEKHALRDGSGRWKRNIWVHCEDEDKIPLWKTPLIKYYTHQANVANRKDSAMRDEFLRCTRCGKEHRPDIKKYHDALNNKCWTCSLWPYQNDPPQQKTSQGNEKKKEDENITQGDPPQRERSEKIRIKKKFKKMAQDLRRKQSIPKSLNQMVKEESGLPIVIHPNRRQVKEMRKRKMRILLKQFRVGDDGKILFDEEELKMILDFKRGEDYIEVLCGATNKKYGDYVGRLKINNEGQYFITCECCPECPLVNVTLEAFEEHALRGGSGRWKRNIWDHWEDEDRVPLWKTPLIKYYTPDKCD